jgi:HEAT repeat protein
MVAFNRGGAMKAITVLIILSLGLLGSAVLFQAQAAKPLAVSSQIDPAIQKNIDRLSAADKIEKGRGFRALQAMGPKAAPAVPRLIDLLGDNSTVGLPNPPPFWEAVGWVRVGDAALMTLGKIGEPAVEPLIRALGSSDPLVRTRALRALQRITGQNFKENQAAWQNWWRTQKSQIQLGQ